MKICELGQRISSKRLSRFKIEDDLPKLPEGLTASKANMAVAADSLLVEELAAFHSIESRLGNLCNLAVLRGQNRKAVPISLTVATQRL